MLAAVTSLIVGVGLAFGVSTPAHAANGCDIVYGDVANMRQGSWYPPYVTVTWVGFVASCYYSNIRMDATLMVYLNASRRWKEASKYGRDCNSSRECRMPSTDTNVTGFINDPVQAFCAYFYWHVDTGPTDYYPSTSDCVGTLPVDTKPQHEPKPDWWPTR